MHSIPPNKAPLQLCAMVASPFYTSLPADLLAEHAFNACMFCVQQTNIVLDKRKLVKLFCLPEVFAKYSFPILKRNLLFLFHKHHRALFAWGTCCYLDAISVCDCLNISPHKPQTPYHVVPFSRTLHCSTGSATCLLAWLCSLYCWSSSHNTTLHVGNKEHHQWLGSEGQLNGRREPTNMLKLALSFNVTRKSGFRGQLVCKPVCEWTNVM